MGAVARMKSVHGGSRQAIKSLTPVTAVDLSLPTDSDIFYLKNAGAVTIPTININMPTRPGRKVTLVAHKDNTNDFTLTNNADTVTKGQMDLGGGDITLGTEDVLVIVQQDNGVWFEASLTDN